MADNIEGIDDLFSFRGDRQEQVCEGVPEGACANDSEPEAARDGEPESMPDTLPACRESAPEVEFTAYWCEYLGAVKAAEEAIDALVNTSEGRLMLRGVRLGERLSGHAMLRQTRKELQDLVYSRAEREFAPPSGSLSIPRYEHEELLGANWAHCDDASFDPDALWKALASKYGGDYGIELGYKQLAAKLVSGFGLRRNKPVRKANRLELTDTIYCEKRYNGTMELSYSSAESVSQLHNAMSAFCEWAKDFDTARRIDARALDMRMNRNRAVVSRTRFDLGGVGYVIYHAKMTWELYGDLGDQFQAFIGRYGREALASNY